MNALRALVGVGALMALTGHAAAVTVKNTSNAEVSIGIDWGNKEKAETIPAGKSVSFECQDGCGVTGPWGFSWMAKGDDVIPTDGKSLVTVGKPPEGE